MIRELTLLILGDLDPYRRITARAPSPHPIPEGPLKHKGRNVVERGYARLKQWRRLSPSYDKLAVVSRESIVLNGVIACLQHLSDMPRDSRQATTYIGYDSSTWTLIHVRPQVETIQ